MLRSSRSGIRAVVLALLAGGAAFAAYRAGADAGSPGRSARDLVAVRGEAASILLPSSQVINIANQIALLDTETGAVYHLEGNLDNASSQLTWRRRVPPVEGSTSGYLQIQRPPFAFNDPQQHFLVDVISGRTWVLRDNASGNGRWDQVTFIKPQGGGLQNDPS